MATKFDIETASNLASVALLRGEVWQEYLQVKNAGNTARQIQLEKALRALNQTCFILTHLPE
jgi:hypothetical protein